MNILVCNDDGINSEGIKALALMLLRKNHRVTVVAPADNRSGYAHSVTFFKDIVLEKTMLEGKIPCYSLTGTPVDCVKYGLTELKEDFDLVCGGINHGSNLGTETFYSGTVAIGLEGNIFNKKSITFSCPHYKNCDFTRASEICGEIIDKYFDKLDSSFTLNVNIPPVKQGENVKGFKVTPLGKRLYTDIYQYSKENVFMLVGDPIKADNPEDCDVELCENGYVTLTPIACNKTCVSAINKLKG